MQKLAKLRQNLKVWFVIWNTTYTNTSQKNFMKKKDAPKYGTIIRIIEQCASLNRQCVGIMILQSFLPSLRENHPLKSFDRHSCWTKSSCFVYVRRFYWDFILADRWWVDQVRTEHLRSSEKCRGELPPTLRSWIGSSASNVEV